MDYLILNRDDVVAKWQSEKLEIIDEKPLYKSVQKKLDTLTLVLRENLSGVRVIRAFAGVKREKERFDFMPSVAKSTIPSLFGL